ncbi:hypothetical protein PRIC1_006505 [Phytophthora ramorum]
MEPARQRRRIWVLLICNLVSTSLQLAVDAYLSLGVGGKTRECDSMFFDDNGGLFEQSLRLVISTGTYLVPNWGALQQLRVLVLLRFELHTLQPLKLSHLFVGMSSLLCTHLFVGMSSLLCKLSLHLDLKQFETALAIPVSFSCRFSYSDCSSDFTNFGYRSVVLRDIQR